VSADLVAQLIDIGRGVAAVVAVVMSLGWLVFYRRVRRGSSRVRAFEDVALVDVTTVPRVSLVVPAMNEAAAMRKAIETFRALDYPDLEIVLVDDRSSDGTGAVVDAAAASDARIKAVHITELPAGWLGKVHAQKVGVEHATGAWLLFTDADVFLDKSALRRGMAHALTNDLDQVVVVAKGNPPSFALDVVECAVAGLIHAATMVRGSGGSAVVGSGQYSLVKRAALDKSAGIAWYKMEPADDFALSLCLRNAGARADFFVSRGHVSFEWYPSFRAMVRGFEKNLFPVATGYRARPAIVIALALVAFNLGPLLAPVAFGPVIGVPIAALACAALVAATVTRARLSGRSALALLLNPLGQVVLALVLVRAMLVVLGRGGLTWRDTFYPLAQLREGQRVRGRRA
jgi:glycosyltransferase involved in cell wall biosynthesis